MSTSKESDQQKTPDQKEMSKGVQEVANNKQSKQIADNVKKQETTQPKK